MVGKTTERLYVGATNLNQTILNPVGDGIPDRRIGQPSDDRFKKVAAGSYHVCGIKIDGTMTCWGATKDSGLTDTVGSIVYGQADVPAEHQDSTFSDVVAAEYHTCAILDGQNDQLEGDVVCWGGEITHDPLRPYKVADGRVFDPDHPYPPPHQFPRISTSVNFNCGLSEDRDLVCWGGSIYSPGIVEGNFKTLGMGDFHVCAIKDSGHINCWGWNNNLQAAGWTPNFDQIEAGTLNPTSLYNNSSRVKNLTTDYTFKSVTAGYFHSCGLLDGQTNGQTEGSVICWGDKQNGQTLPPDGMTFSYITAGLYHTCGLLDAQNDQSAGTAVCWGASTSNWGQADVPAELEEVVLSSISASRFHTCAIRADNNKIVCWGNQLLTELPDEIAEKTFIAMDTGVVSNCAINSESLVDCWGPTEDASASWLAIGEQFRIPTDYAETRFRDISASLDHACATKEDGRAICWGADADVSTPQLEIYGPHSSVPGAFTIINTRQAWVPREFRATPINPPLPTPTPEPRPPGSVRILRIEPDIRGVSFRPGETARLDIEVYGRQDARDDTLGDRSDITFEWVAEDLDGLPGPGNGSFAESVNASQDRVRNQIPDDRRALYTAPADSGRYRVRTSLDIGTECLPARDNETEQDAIDRCTAIFEITVRRVTPPGPTPEAPIDPIDTPDVIVGPDGTNYEVFTPSQGGEFVEGPCSFKAPHGAVHNNEVIGVVVTILDDDVDKLPVEDPRFITDGIQCRIQAVDLQGSRLIDYQLRQPGELCMPLPDRFRTKAVDTIIGTISEEDAMLTRLTSSIFLASRQGELKVCGNLSELSATTTVALPGEVVEELPPTPTPPQISEIDTGGSRFDPLIAIIALMIGIAIVMTAIGVGTFKRGRKIHR